MMIQFKYYIKKCKLVKEKYNLSESVVFSWQLAWYYIF